MFFALRPERWVLSDINPELIKRYRQVKNDVRTLLSHLREMPVDQSSHLRSFPRRRGGYCIGSGNPIPVPQPDSFRRNVPPQPVEGDFVYCDPTYTVAHNNNGFIRYNERSFSWDDQIRLARRCHGAVVRGATVVVSNAYHSEVLRLFAPPVDIVVSRASRLRPHIEHRRTVEEFLFPAAANGKTLKTIPKRGTREK